MSVHKPLFVDNATEHTTGSILPCSPILSSIKAGWQELFLAYHFQPFSLLFKRLDRLFSSQICN